MALFSKPVLRIYFTDESPKRAAQALDDVNLITGALEGAKICCSALYRRNLWNTLMYRPQDEFSPVVKWASDSRNNFLWAYHYADSLCQEYFDRFRKDSEYSLLGDVSHRIILGHCIEAYRARRHAFQASDLTEFPNITRYKSTQTIDAYRRALNEDVWSMVRPSWTKSKAPEWFREPMKYPVGQFA